jgi:hypothetical protein
MGDRLEVVDGMDALEPEPPGHVIAAEAPIAVGELDLVAVNRARHGEHGGLGGEAGLVEIAADRRLRPGNRLVVDDRHPFRTAAGHTHSEARDTSTDIGEQNAGHADTPTPSLPISTHRGISSAIGERRIVNGEWRIGRSEL